VDEERTEAGSELERAVHFTGACFAISWGLALGLWLAVGPAEKGAGAPGGPPLDEAQGAAFAAAWLLMSLIPGATALALRLVRKEEGTGMGYPTRHWRAYLVAYLLGTGFLALSFGISWLVGLAPVSPQLESVTGELASTAGWTEPSAYLWALAFFSSTVSPMILAVPAFVEEYGWRGYLLRCLLPHGPWTAALVTGFLWALWQLPIILLLRLYDPAPVWAVVPTALAVFTAVGTVLGLLALRWKSVWVPALAQAVVLAHMTVYSLCLSDPNPLIGGPSGLVGLAVCGGYLGWEAFLRRRPGDIPES
jgi:membrane protease YdiL (CAAX protease family)